MVREDGETEMVTTTTVTAGLSPQHKAAIVLFLERVYGVQDQITFYRLLENGFLPDLRAATTLEEVSIGQIPLGPVPRNFLVDLLATSPTSS